MGIFDRFPYSSTHEMNLDFMLGKATEIAESLQEIDTHKEQAEQAATNAAQAEQAAAGSQTAAGTSASQAAQHKADAEDAADRAEAASDLADKAVEQAQAAVTQAQTAADGAVASATAAETRINNLAASLPEDFTELNDEVNNLKSAFDSVVSDITLLTQYLYKENTYVTTAETAISGYNLYRIPVSPYDIIYITWEDAPSHFWSQLSSSYALRMVLSDDTYRLSSSDEFIINEADKNLTIVTKSDAVYVSICANQAYAQYVRVYKNVKSAKINNESIYPDAVMVLPTTKSIISRAYIGWPSGNFALWPSNLTYYAITMKVKAGDKIGWPSKPIELSRLMVYRDAETGTLYENSSSLLYEFTSDALASVYCWDGAEVKYYPADSIKLEYKNIVNIPASESGNPYANLQGVAFGTSLTYRALTTGGYLQYLPTMSGISFDNQGLGSSVILANGSQPDMMPKITGYTGYAGKRVCILEGFVNDWYYNGNSLGTWKDSEQNTVCGCVRYAINHILTQNPQITLFLVLDHFGKGITASNAINSANQTQLEFYQEIEKVALSLGVRVIRGYEISEISELTPQYLLDNIHLNNLGAQQSANAIWSEMKRTYPNVVS